ncbi:MAG: recombinase family protein [Synergistaceae bacterium]|jgi:hypothetical protein|nr:recombinase family protein [Synergistaceae bacterium]
MSLKKSEKSHSSATFSCLTADSGLAARMENLSEQTGLTPSDLLQKWILEEEVTLKAIRRSEENILKRLDARLDTVLSKADSVHIPPEEPAERTCEVLQFEVLQDKDFSSMNTEDYRQMLVKNIKKLRKDGKTYSDIARSFNGDGVATISGTGKWYPASVSTLLNSH